MKTLKVLYLCIVVILVSCNDDEADVTVEFSSPLADRPIENAKNASIVTSDEIETRVPYDPDRDKLSSVYVIDSNSSGKSEISHPDNASVPVEGSPDNATSNATESKTKMKVECTPRVLSEDEIPAVVLANNSALLQVLAPVSGKNSSSGECAVVLFYSNQCVFSARMAPHFNALPRVFPDIRFYAVDVLETGNLYVRYGLVYVPNVMLFHNSKPFARYNETVLNLDQFVKFINKFTGLQHNGTLNVTSGDMSGPVPSVLVRRVDHVLVLAWCFTLCCLCFGFAKSSFFKRTVEFLRNTWHEANPAQHEHED